MKKVGLVIAHHHDNFDFFVKWVDEIYKSSANYEINIYFCLDMDKTIDFPYSFSENVKILLYNRKDIKKDLGEKSWIIPTRTSAIKSYGFLKAYEHGCDYIMTIDNDCFPDTPNFIDKHVENLESNATLGWVKTLAKELEMRGNPYLNRRKSQVMISHGLWSNIPDLDAATQLLNPEIRLKSDGNVEVVPQYNYFSLCGMNFAFCREAIPALYYGLQGPDFPFNRFDDIWSGVIAKKVMDHLGYAVTNGAPWIFHERQSNVYKNLIAEAPGVEINEYFWKDIDNINLHKCDTIKKCMIEIVDQFPIYEQHSEYFNQLKDAYKIWIKLIEERT